MANEIDSLLMPTDFNPLEHLTWLRDGFKDEIPDQIVNSFSPDLMYKARVTWFTGVLGNLDSLCLRGMIPAELQSKVADFTQKYYKILQEDPKTFRTKPEHIQEANDLIDNILGRNS